MTARGAPSCRSIYLQSRARYSMTEGLSGFADTDHPMEVWDSTYGQPGGRGILMSFIQGPKARELGRSSRAEQLRFELKTIEDVYPGVRRNYERGFVKVWDRDPWARGAVAYLLPGQVLSLEPHIARPEGRIHFRRRACVVAARLDAGRIRIRPACGQRS